MSLQGRIIAVSGSRGFVGRRVVRRLLELGAEVRELTLQNGVDMTDWNQVSGIERFDTMVHLAARTFVPESFTIPRETLAANFHGILNALEVCRRWSARMIFASTYVYGEPQHLPIREDHPAVPMNPYTESKVLGERLCHCYHRDFGVSSTVLRAFNIYGPGQDVRFLIPTIVAQARKGEIGLQSGRPRRDFVHVDDIADAYVATVTVGRNGNDVFNLGSGTSHAVSEIAEMIRRKVNPDCKITYSNESRKGEIFDTVADITRAGNLLGWKPRISLEQGIESCIQPQSEKPCR